MSDLTNEDEMPLKDKWGDGITVAELVKYLQQYSGDALVHIPKQSVGSCRGASIGRNKLTKGMVCIR